MSETRVKGLAELQRALDGLPAKIEANIMRGALRAGAKVIAAEARRNVHSVSGALADSIRVGTKSSRGTVIGRVVAGGKSKLLKDNSAAFYGRFVEFGTAAHVIRAKNGRLLALGVSKVNHPGAKKKPFMRPALDTMATAAVEAVREYIRNRLASKHGIDVPAPLEEGDE